MGKVWKIYKHTLVEDCGSKGKSYIGLTEESDVNSRWQNGNGYNAKRRNKKHTIFWKAINKHGGLEMWDVNWTHEIIEDNIATLELASEREKYWIAYYHTYIGDDMCWGYNMTRGGQGWSHRHSEQTKQKISESLKGRVFTEEHKAKLSLKLRRKPIVCVETGIEYESVSEAARQTGIKRENIKTALNGKRLSAGGYHWAQVGDQETIAELKKLSGKCKPSKQKILCVETGIIYESIAAAAKAIGAKCSANITSALTGRYEIAYGYHWKRI